MSEKTPALPLGPALVLFGIVGVLLIALLADQPRIPPAIPATPTEVVVSTPTQPVQNVASADDAIRQGQTFFSGTCFACHGFDARGIPGLGKNLVESAFIHDMSDADLLAFIIEGRNINDPLNTTGVAMPARGGNPSLTDDQLMSIIAYLRSLQAGQQIAAAPTTAPGAETTGEPFVLPIEGMNLNTPTPAAPFVLPIEGMNLATPELTTRVLDPATVYAVACSTCHGVDGAGGSASGATAWTMTDDEIFALLTTMLPMGSPVAQHPLYGGYLNLNDDEVRLLIDYLHTLPTS